MAQERLVTPEAVELDLQTATIATRSLGRLLDLLLQTAVVLLLVVGVGQVLEDTAGLVAAMLALFLVRVTYAPWLETRYGATLGQRAMGLRIRSTDGGPVRLRQALVRVAVGLFEIDATAGLVAMLVAGARQDGRRLGDLAAGTVAVSVRTGTGQARVVTPTCPPALAGWAACVDPTGVDGPRRVALRRYLERAQELTPHARDRVALPLAQRLVADLRLAWPAGADADEVLRAVAAAVGSATQAPASGGTGTADVAAPGRDGPPPPPPATGFTAPG